MTQELWEYDFFLCFLRLFAATREDVILRPWAWGHAANRDGSRSGGAGVTRPGGYALP